MPHLPHIEDRLDAWYDDSSVCVIAVGGHGDPLDLDAEEVEAFIAKLQKCVKQLRARSGK